MNWQLQRDAAEAYQAWQEHADKRGLYIAATYDDPLDTVRGVIK